MTPLIILMALVGLGNSQNLTFNNPVFGFNYGRPGISKVGNNYYLTLSESKDTEVAVYKSPVLTNFRNSERRVAYKIPDGYTRLLGCVMQLIDDELYIYLSMRSDWDVQGIYVIKANNASDPLGGWSDAIRLLDGWNYFSVDGIVMKHNNGLYFLWVLNLSTPTSPESIYIAPMTSPIWVGNPKVLLREPKEEWECHKRCVSIAPFLLYNQNVTYMVFSTSDSAHPNFCVSYMSIRDGLDPLNVTNWSSINEPVFYRNDDQDVYTTGHTSFTTSPDGSETWMVYHGTVSANASHISGRRTSRLEKIDWNDDGSPRFPKAHGYDQPQAVPSGQTAGC